MQALNNDNIPYYKTKVLQFIVPHDEYVPTVIFVINSNSAVKNLIALSYIIYIYHWGET